MVGNSACIGPLVVAQHLTDEFLDNVTLCISARVYYKTVYDIVQYGGLSLFSLGTLINILYFILARMKIGAWNQMQRFNVELLFAALLHVVWLSVDMLSFNNIFPVMVERLFRDIPCWLITSSSLHFLVIWYNANNRMNPNKIFTQRNVYIFQIILISLDFCNRGIQQYFNNPALFAIFESVFVSMLSTVTFIVAILCNILLFQTRQLVDNKVISKNNKKFLKFYTATKKFYILLAPGCILFSILGFSITATRALEDPMVMAADHLWSVTGHILSWGALNYILWKHTFKNSKKQSTSSSLTMISNDKTTTNSNDKNINPSSQ
jgi:hypothetical protein